MSKAQYTGPRVAHDSTVWLRGFAGRYQSIRGGLRGLSLEAERRLPSMRKNEKKKVEEAIHALDAAFTALNNPVDLEEQQRDPLADPQPRGPYR